MAKNIKILITMKIHFFSLQKDVISVNRLKL